MKQLIETYNKIKPGIDNRLAEFTEIWRSGTDGCLFREMAFCMCTPQTSAHKGHNAVTALFDSGVLLTGSENEIAAVLRGQGVRFHNHKAHYIKINRDNFYPKTREHITKILSDKNPHETFCKQVEGWGLKEAAHFLRNIGFGESAAILDRHILRQLALYDVIPAVPASLSKQIYFEIDKKMKAFSKKIGIPLSALDFVFWYEETGEIFK